MISLIQMLGTARRVRQAIRELPTRDAADTSRQARLTGVLQQDFCQPESSICASSKNCRFFTESFRKGVQQDAEEALRCVLNSCALVEGTEALRGRGPSLSLGVSQMHQFFSVIVEWRRGCFAETSLGARCKSISSKLEEFLVLYASVV